MQYGHVLNVYDPLNFDIGLWSPDYVAGKKTTHYELYTYCYIDTIQELLDFDEKGVDFIQGKSYRCHLKDIRFKNNARLHPDYGIAKKMLIQWTDFTNGWVLHKIYNIDIYDRLIVELFDPYTTQSFKDYLLTNFPSIFCSYQYHNTPTVHLSDFSYNREIKRPDSLELPAYVQRAPLILPTFL